MRAAFLPLALVGIGARTANAADFAPARLDLGGKIKAVRARDLDGDGRADLIVLVERREPDRLPVTELVLLHAPKVPASGTFFGAENTVRVPCSGDAAGGRASAGAVAIGRFGPKGEVRLRFLGPAATPDLASDGSPVADSASTACILERSPGEALAFWEGVADVDGDGRDECFVPGTDGSIDVLGVTIPPTETASRSDDELFVRSSRSPRLTFSDLDGDGIAEILRIEGDHLVVEQVKTAKSPALTERISLAKILAPDPSRPPEELHAPRITIADVNGDRKADLLVTLIHGRADKLGGLRTSFYFFPGPFYDAATGALVESSSRIDTESVALHPRFVDLDGDGDLDYVVDSIRGKMFDLIKRVTGAEPTIWYTAFRFDQAAKRFEKEPYCDVERPYSGPEARANTFGRSGFCEGDFDGDGVRDLLDLGNLTKLVILKGTKGDDAFTSPLLAGISAPSNATFVADAVIADLNGDGRSDAVLTSDRTLLLVVSKGAK